MTELSHDSNAEFRLMMTASAQQVVAGERPYEIAMRLLGSLATVLTTADYAGSAAYVWGFLTDGIDGPPQYARGLSESEIEDLMRQAASEWLELDQSAESLEMYFERWSDWPDAVRRR